MRLSRRVAAFPILNDRLAHRDLFDSLIKLPETAIVRRSSVALSERIATECALGVDCLFQRGDLASCVAGVVMLGAEVLSLSGR